MSRLLRSLAPLCLLPASFAWTPVARAGDVTVYRCIGKNGNLTLRDTPCMAGETQQVITMAKPQDPPPRPAPPVDAAPAAAAPAAPVRETVIIRTPAQPMYECTDAETGDAYASDDGDGNPRWVPLWTMGYPAAAPAPPGHGYIRAEHDRNGTRASGGFDSGGHRPPRPPPAYPGIGGTWVRDACHMLPQQEVCARLSDRVYEIQRRYYSALQSERRALDLEQRGIEARMANDCGSYR